MNPIPKWVVGALVVIALVAGIWFHGRSAGSDAKQAEWDASVERGKKEVARLRSEAGKITTRVVTQYVDRVVTIKGDTREIIRQVPVFVPAGACELPAGFRLLHDAAAEGSVPDPGRIADGAPVDAQTVAETVADNYGTCRVIAARLTALQQWVTEQQALNPETDDE